MKVLVCGGRDFSNYEYAFDQLDYFHKNVMNITHVLHGAAKGADSIAEQWSKMRQIAYTGVPAKWGQLGKAAGMSRNQRMLDEFSPDVVFAFPGGRGTDGMIKISKEAGVKVWRVE